MIYLDTSAALKLVIREPESVPLVGWLAGQDEQVVASWLLHAEMHRALTRRKVDVDRGALEDLLAGLVLVDVTRGDLFAAPSVGAGLRTLEALHLATAIRVQAHTLATYDDELSTAARSAGLKVVAPHE